MKIRTGFVSNSSSTSFTCDNCKTFYDYSGNSVYCYRSHGLCGSCFDRDAYFKEQTERFLKEDIEVLKNYWAFTETEVAAYPSYSVEQKRALIEECLADDCEILEEFCPICNFSKIPSDIVLTYLYEKLGLSGKEVRTEIKEKYINMGGWLKRGSDED
jgi:hypothetical protein